MGGGGGGASCDNAVKFCDTPDKIVRADCAALGTHDCMTGLLLTGGGGIVPPVTGGGGGEMPTTCKEATHDCTTGIALDTCTENCGAVIITPDTVIVPDPECIDPAANLVKCHVTRATYTPTDPVPAHPAPGSTFADWDAAIEHYETPAYSRSAGDQIGAAYAHARGYTGEGVVVSSMDSKVGITNGEILNNILRPAVGTDNGIGYIADTRDSDDDAGTCNVAPTCALSDIRGSHLAGIIISDEAPSITDKTQGVAYDAILKPIDIVTGDVYKDATKNDDLILAIGQASGIADTMACNGLSDADKMTADVCKPITVMNNGWDNSITAIDVKGSDIYEYQKARSPNLVTIPQLERDAWATAVETTVVVFGAGDQGHNSINGLVKLTHETSRVESEELWSVISASATNPADRNRNEASSHARLASVESDLAGKWLTVIALKDDNEIWEYSNGCGDTKAYCLGAPGVGIYSNILISPGHGERSGTAQAAAHVSGAVAVLKSAFPHLTPAELVEVILATADDLGIEGVDEIYGHGALNLARATSPIGLTVTATASGAGLGADASLDDSGITLPTSFGESLNGFTVGFIDDYNRAYIGNPGRITRENAAFTLGDTIATWDSPELQSIALDSNSKMQFTNYDENSDAKDTLIFTHNLPNHTIGFAYNEESKTPDLNLTDKTDEMHFQKIRPITSDLMQLNATHKLGKAWNVKNSLTSGEFDTGNRFNEAMANLNYTGENHNLTIGAGTLKEYGQFLGASGTGAYQLSDATSSQVTHLAISQNLPLNSAIKLKYTNFKTEVDMRYNNFANINNLTADEYQLSLTKKQIWGKSDSLNIELIQPFAVTDGNLQQNTVLGYTAAGDYNNVTQNYNLKPTNRRQQLRMTWQNQINNLKTKTNLFISMQYENHVDNVRDNEDSSILGGISTRF